MKKQRGMIETGNERVNRGRQVGEEGGQERGEQNRGRGKWREGLKGRI